jgi:peptide/nickel transport system permease protein
MATEATQWEATITKERTSRSWKSLAWRQFRSNRVAVISAIFLIAMYLVAIFATAIAPYNPNEVDISATNARPSARHLLGTDEDGRDVLSRVIVGSRVSMTVGLIAMAIAVAIGSLIGGVSGYFSGIPDSILMRFTDGMMAIPYFFLVLIVVAVFGSSFQNIVIVIGVSTWMGVARLVRAEVIRFRDQDFVLAARSIGVPNVRILIRHIMPHALSSIIVAATLGVAGAILLESALSYLGLGIRPPTSDWGAMLSNSQAYVFADPLMAVYPGICILLTVLAYNFIGDALRDALDPQLLRG